MLLQSLLRPVLTPLMRGMFDAPIFSSSAWSPLALWPDGVNSPGMWIDPSLLTASFNDYLGTTPVATPGTVADSANPVGLALDIRAGAPTTLGPELVVNGDFATDLSGWTVYGDYVVTRDTTIFPAGAMKVLAPTSGINGYVNQDVGTTATKTYLVSATFYSPSSNPSTYPQGCLSLYSNNDIALWPGVEDEIKTVQWVVPGGASSIPLNALLFAPYREWGPAGSYFYITDISVKEVPGNHMLQSTSAARPLLSARRNLLTYTGDLSGWNKDAGVTITPNYGTAPDSTATSVRVQFSGPNMQTWLTGLNGGGNPGIVSVWVKGAAGETIQIAADFAYAYTVTLTGAWQEVENYSAIANAFSLNTYVSSTARDIEVWHPQFERGAEATEYQAVPGDGSTYDATGIAPWQVYDGTDDGMATASFAAGTLTSGMDCMIAVRRDSGANCVAGLYNGIADATKFFGMAESGSGSGCVGSGAGTPTVWVDNTQLTGGTAVTRGTLHTALTAGNVHILEFQDLDLSAWTATGFGLYTSYVFPGARGDIMLFPSTASTADKDAARQYLADKYGVTLP